VVVASVEGGSLLLLPGELILFSLQFTAEKTKCHCNGAAGMNINWGLLREEERKKLGGAAASLGLGLTLFFCKCLFYFFVGFW